jgi:hypothetical protein
VLFLLGLAARHSAGSEVHFAVPVRNDNRERTPPLVRLKALCEPLPTLPPDAVQGPAG